MKRKGLLIVAALVFLMITVDRTHASCSTEVVYPLLYGTGTWDLFINDIASFSSGDILVGGKSLSTKSAGEGFIMRIDKYGAIKWQNIYQSTETGEDSVDRVAVQKLFMKLKVLDINCIIYLIILDNKILGFNLSGNNSSN